MNRKHRWNRRQWISAAAAALPGRSFASLGRLFGNVGAGPVREAVDTKFKAFPLSQVRLRPGIFLDQLESNQSFIESLPNDRLLHTFRLTAGIPSTADPLGGWEHTRGELRGHFVGGHVLSACALLHAATGDDALKQKGNVLVAELAKCQQKLNQDGYLSAYPTSFYDRLKEGKRVWAPFYTYHKILAGHLDMFTLCGNEQALATAEKMAGWVDKYLKPISDEQWAKMQMVEHGGMNESLFNLYALTGKEQYLALARRFDHKKFFDPLAERKDELKGLHVNTNIPKVIGAARGYELTGDRSYADAAYYAIAGGCVTALAAGASGAVDYLDIPPRTKSKKTANLHALLNLSILGVWGLNYLLRQGKSGATIAARVLPQQQALIVQDIERIARSVQLP